MILPILKAFWRKRSHFFQKKWQRILPFGDYVSDRWEKAALLGFGEGSSIYDNSFVFGDVVVGRNVWVGPSTILDGSGGKLEIGDFCCISAGVQIYTHDTVKRFVSAFTLETEVAPTKIGPRCYIGPNCVVTKGVTIGEGCIIGAFSLVNKDLPPNSKAFGVPCKVMGSVKNF